MKNPSFDQGLDFWDSIRGSIEVEAGSIKTFTRTTLSQNLSIAKGESFLVYYEFEVLNASDLLEITFSDSSGNIEKVIDTGLKSMGTYSGWGQITSLETYEKVLVGTMNNFGADSRIKEVKLFKILSSDYCVNGSNGIIFGEYGGGFHMVDSDWIRICGNKGFYQNEGIMRTDGILQVGESRLIVDIDGKVGIGTITPDELLTVKGNIHAQEVQVDLAGALAPDYVFEKYYEGVSQLKVDYTMPTLEEVAQFTRKHKHLPNIPSAQELEENGMHLKEMTRLLLQKIEELTLYTIEQQKEIQVLKESKEIQDQRIQRLESQIQ